MVLTMKSMRWRKTKLGFYHRGNRLVYKRDGYWGYYCWSPYMRWGYWPFKTRRLAQLAAMCS